MQPISIHPQNPRTLHAAQMPRMFEMKEVRGGFGRVSSAARLQSGMGFVYSASGSLTELGGVPDVQENGSDPFF